VTHLKLYRPDGFEFHPAEYIYLRIPKISRFGWHPFTISSCPEERDYIGLHIRALGNWTRRLHNQFGGLAADRQQIPVEFHGPYGTPSTRIFSSRYAVLIGGGIGVTPFASILRSITLRREAGQEMRLKKVYFFWLYNGQATFLWFSQLLLELDGMRKENELETNIYLTDVRINATTGLLRAGMDLIHSRSNYDLLTGLHSRTSFGRPDWAQIFPRIASELHDAHVSVFFCGPYPLGRAVKTAARRFGFGFRMEKF
jgi:predicted ferric reductase